MLKDCTLFSFLFWLSFIALIGCDCKNIFTIIVIKTLIFSLVFYPMFCGILHGNLLKFFNKNYFKCLKNGIILYSINTFTGTILMIPFIVAFHSSPAKFNIFTAVLGGIGATVWLILLTNIVFCSFWPEKNIFKTIIYSTKLCKNNHIKIFTLFLKTYIGIILIIPSPWVIKNFIYKINRIKNILTTKFNQQINYSAHNFKQT